jgi:flagellar motor protein MotB
MVILIIKKIMMKNLTVLTGSFFLCSTFLNAQSTTTERVKENAKWKTEQKVNQKVDKAIDDVLDGNIFKKKPKAARNNEEDSAFGKESTNRKPDNPTPNNAVQEPSSFKAYSKFDFVSGEKVLYYEDFERVDIGDFPADFNTNASGEVMTLEGKPGKWLVLTKNGSFLPEAIGELPENFTLEMNVGIIGDPSNNFTGFGFNFNTEKENLIGCSFCRGAFVNLHPGGASASMNVSQAGGGNMDNDFKMPQWDVDGNPFARISLWRQKGRLRVYVNEEKLMDIPRFFIESKPYGVSFGRNFFRECNVFVSDIKFAVGAPDTRNKLITEGRFATTGILFDFQKAIVKPESYGVIKEIATALKENPAVKINIIGHTSNDGDANANLTLSKQRAAAVKQVLTNEFGIDAARMETDGKGGAEPVDKTGSSAGKANNRRVEFIKL